MKKLSHAGPADFETLIHATENITGVRTAKDLAQTFVDIVHDHFQESLILLRLFLSLPYCALPVQDQQLVDKKAKSSGTEGLLKGSTPILTLLGTRGQRPDWNERSKSQGFRCIPMVSSGYVASLPMLAMQFRKMNLDLGLFDAWDTTVIAKGRADAFAGMLYVNNAAADKDEQDRMIVPRQDFVAENDVKTVLGFGNGYVQCPAVAALFAFTNEILDKAAMEPFGRVLQIYTSASEDLVRGGRIFH